MFQLRPNALRLHLAFNEAGTHPGRKVRISLRIIAVIRQRQSDRITPVIRTEVIESPWPPYVAAKFAPTKTAS